VGDPFCALTGLTAAAATLTISLATIKDRNHCSIKPLLASLFTT
jgi:hypothetical protein